VTNYTDEDIEDYVINCMSNDEILEIVQDHTDILSLWDLVKEVLLDQGRSELEMQIDSWKKRHGYEEYADIDFKREMWEIE
jgi:hypothetical protein